MMGTNQNSGNYDPYKPYYNEYETAKQIRKVQEDKRRAKTKNKISNKNISYPGYYNGNIINLDNNYNYDEILSNKNYQNKINYQFNYNSRNAYSYYSNNKQQKAKNVSQDDYNIKNNMNTYNKNSQIVLCGLKNIGNNCYLNSGLQILARCSSFVDKIGTFYDVKYPLTALLYETFYNLLKEKIYDPSPFVKQFCAMNQEFNIGEQSCSQNFIRTVLNNVNKEIKSQNINVKNAYIDYFPKDLKEKTSYNNYIKKNEILPESDALSIFSGILKSHLKGLCQNCKNYIDNYSFCYFIDQNMYLDSISKDSCDFEQVIQENIACNDIIMDCEKCMGKETVKVKEETKIVKLPEILIFTLERYLNGTNKINVIPNDIIELSPYIDINLKTDTTKYELFAKNIRFGSTKRYGHEICQIKIGGTWYEFNDDSAFEKRGEYNDCTYGLFYKKKKY